MSCALTKRRFRMLPSKSVGKGLDADLATDQFSKTASNANSGMDSNQTPVVVQLGQAGGMRDSLPITPASMPKRVSLRYRASPRGPNVNQT